MRHRARWLARLGLCLCLALAAIWAASLRWGVRYERGRIGFNLYDGGCVVWIVKVPDGRGQGLHINDVTIRRRSWMPTLPCTFSNPREDCLSVPLWMPLVLLAVVTAALLRVSRKADPDRCATCEYDLRGNQSGRCPECGVSASGSDPHPAG